MPESRSRRASAVSRRNASRAASESSSAAADARRVRASASSPHARRAVAPSGSLFNANGHGVCRGSINPSRVVLRHFASASSRRMPLRGSGRSAVDAFHARRRAPRKSAPRWWVSTNRFAASAWSGTFAVLNDISSLREVAAARPGVSRDGALIET